MSISFRTFGAIATDHIAYGDVDEGWSPKDHAKDVMAQQLINRVDDARDRDYLYRLFLDGEEHSEERYATLDPSARSAYDFLANEDPQAREA